MCDIETLEPCSDDECEGLIVPNDYELEEEDSFCGTCYKRDCICDYLTDTYRERDLF